MIDPGTVEIVGGLTSAAVALGLGYMKNKGKLDLQRLNNRVVSEALFTTELARRDEALDKIRAELATLTKNYTEQHERDMTEIESWKDKYLEQVEVNEKLQLDIETLKKPIIETI